ncbi:cysteine hydrolase family protein, partial [Trichloromonas sp.]|uniref:cysteine hydrolase family protein n=1 Tax=Trichloromonas sp. TaxID=3069249 RepID=UPI003D816097
AVLEVPRARRIVPALQSRLAEARRAGIPVVYVCDAHESDDREFERMGWPRHAVRGTDGAQVIAELAPAAGEDIVCKTTYSGFAGTALAQVLERLGVDELILTGCVTNICVLYTAADAVMCGYRVRVPADLVADLDEADGQFALAQMEKVLGVSVER